VFSIEKQFLKDDKYIVKPEKQHRNIPVGDDEVNYLINVDFLKQNFPAFTGFHTLMPVFHSTFYNRSIVGME